MKFKGLSVILACVCCLSIPMQVNAAEVDSTTAVATAVTEEVQPLAAGLISGYIFSLAKYAYSLHQGADMVLS